MSIDTAATLQPAEAKTFPQLIRAAAAAYGDVPAITLKGDTIPDDAASFRELDERSAELARGLLARGAGKGTRVGFIAGNGPFFALLFAAIGRIGAVAVPISTLIKANELVRVLRQSDVSCLIVQRELLGNDYAERLCDALPELRSAGSPELRIAKTPFLRWIATFGEGLPASFYAMEFLTDAAATVSDELLREAEAEVHPTDQLIEIYTSGSMALPKGVKHLLVCGRAIGGDRVSHAATRNMACCAVAGQGAGIAAALSIKAGCDVDQVAMPQLQAELARQGVRYL